MEQVSCALCGEHSSLPFLLKQDRFSGTWFTYVRCPRCGLVYLTPRPDSAEIFRYYPIDYEAYKTAPESFKHRWRPAGPRQAQYNFIARHVHRTGRLLDVGCGVGDFLDYAKRNGWQVIGSEINTQAASIAQTTYDVNIYAGPLDEVPMSEAGFDIVTMWDVLEHLPDPYSALLYCHRLLREDGLLVISIPNLASFDRFLFREAWIGWDAPRHFNLFDHNTLQQLFKQTGFSFIDRQCVTGAKGAFFLSLDPILDNTRNRSLYHIFRPLLSPALWPYRQLSYHLMRGPVITYAARKV